MAAITIRSLPEEVHRALRVRAARHDRSTEAEIIEAETCTLLDNELIIFEIRALVVINFD